jgi:hypothetical protein
MGRGKETERERERERFKHFKLGGDKEEEGPSDPVLCFVMTAMK